VGRLANLTDLDLSNTAITDEGLEYIAELSGLCCLSLDGSGVSDNGLRFLAALTDLGHLSLTDCDITTTGAKSLSRTLARCAVTVSGGIWMDGEFDPT